MNNHLNFIYVCVCISTGSLNGCPLHGPPLVNATRSSCRHRQAGRDKWLYSVIFCFICVCICILLFVFVFVLFSRTNTSMIGTVGMLEIEAREKHFSKWTWLSFKRERMSSWGDFNTEDYLPGGWALSNSIGQGNLMDHVFEWHIKATSTKDWNWGHPIKPTDTDRTRSRSGWRISSRIGFNQHIFDFKLLKT